MRILVVDDDLWVQNLLKVMLGKLHNIDIAASSEEALSILERRRPDVILLDQEMPGENGIELFDKLKKIHKVPPSTIMMTAHSSLNLAVTFMRNGGTEFIEKPVDIELLKLKIEQVVKRAKEHRELRQMQLEKETASRTTEAKDDLIASVSHELRTPLNSILGFAQMITLHPNGGKKTPLYADSIVKSARHLTSIINDLLDISHLESGKVSIDQKKVDLYNTVEEVMVALRQQASSKGLEIHNEIPMDFPPANADKQRLVQVLFNLVGNSIKFTNQGEITIRAEAVDDKKLKIYVIDTGCGIPQAEKEAVFNRFHRAKNGQMLPGLGLGLSITRKLVSLMKGEINLESTEGKGSKIQFTLPIWRMQHG